MAWKETQIGQPIAERGIIRICPMLQYRQRLSVFAMAWKAALRRLNTLVTFRVPAGHAEKVHGSRCFQPYSEPRSSRSPGMFKLCHCFESCLREFGIQSLTPSFIYSALSTFLIASPLCE